MIHLLAASYVSCTEASTSACTGREVAVAATAPCNVRRHRSEPFIDRWNVVVHRPLRQQEQATAGDVNPAQDHGQGAPDVVPSVSREVVPQEPAPPERRIPYLLFPYRNLIASKGRRPNPRAAMYR